MPGDTAEYWVRSGDEAALRREVQVLPRAALWLAGVLDGRGSSDEATQALAALADNPAADERHREEARRTLATQARREQQ